MAALRAGFLAWIRLAGDPVVRRILLIDAPSVLGWERWRSMEERHALGLAARASSAVAASPASPALTTIASASIWSSNQLIRSRSSGGRGLGYDRLVPDPGFDASKPHIARVYDYLLGGKDNFAADRAVGEQIIAQLPAVQVGVRAQRDVLGRVVRFLVGEAGIRQLLDIGSGLPTAENVHEIAQRIDPATRVVYLDDAPVVLSHARALLADDMATFAVDGDLRNPAGILAHPEVRKHLDWEQPIGLLLCGILHYILDEENPAGLVATLYEALPSGSYVFIHHMLDGEDPASATLQAAMQQGLGRSKFRTFAQIRELFDGLELIDPGLVFVSDWRPDPGTPGVLHHPVLKLAAAGVARKP